MIDFSLPPFTRGHPDDIPFWQGCFVYNEYRVSSFDPNGLVVDLGVNIGAFSAKAYSCGARNIVGVEMDEEAYSVAVKNLETTGARVFRLAVVSPKNDTGDAQFSDRSLSRFIDTHAKVGAGTTTLDKLVGDDEVQFLKIDIEGSEWEVLYTANCLDRVQEISGEFHEPCPTWSLLEQDPELPEYSGPVLESFLREKGFSTEFSSCCDPVRSGLFWAWRGNRMRTFEAVG